MKRCSITLSHAIWQESKWYLINQQSISLASMYQANYSVFFKRKQHFLRLGIRGLVVRLQQESKSENSTRLITDWTIKLVQCKVIPNQDEIWHMRRFSSLEFGHFRVSKQKQFHWMRSGRKAEFGQRQFVQHSSMARAALTTQGWDPTKAVKNWASAAGFCPHSTTEGWNCQQSGEPSFGHGTADINVWPNVNSRDSFPASNWEPETNPATAQLKCEATT